ncbi:uncharacterized protein LOC112502139 [Cynara cardunculus var. scolymus]|uniref:uncharacterized protein LOC112502139 n=1 Tax=Cynara cardunculus var. scolymus TaxID=59895 RepID=UPI000D626984|nr:uncharacterized protein LOC112502139 [Cynara cardunculus var. scolymus]
MGIISRKILPACANMCVCCPALRSRSRLPVKRYKKLLADIFPKSADGSPNERKIAKLCAYAAKNPFRTPRIANYLEERCYKELRNRHIKMVIVITEVYNKLLCTCKEQMACFATNLLNVCIALLDDNKRDTVRIIGCQTLTRFIYNQVDGSYAYDLENLAPKIFVLAHKTQEGDEKIHLRAASLQCLSAMIVHVTLENYEPDRLDEANHNWVHEVVRCEGRDVGSEISSSYMIARPRKEKKDPSLLTREEIVMPKVWAQVCIQRMVELARESTTMRRVLDPMFVYFDTNRQWVPLHGLGFVVLSDVAYFVESPGNQQLILASLVHHLDHKNVSHDPQVKSYIMQTVTALARQVRSEVALTDIGYISDLCRHLKKSLQATVESVKERELNLNTSLQSSVEDCLLELVRGIANARPLFDKMAMTLEKLPTGGVVAWAITGSMIILAHMIVVSSNSLQVFPEGLHLQLLKLMVHPDVEIRSGGHHIFSVLLIPNSKHLRHDASNHTRWRSDAASVFTSVASLLDKLQKENDGTRAGKREFRTLEKIMKKGNTESKMKQVKKSPNFQKLCSIMDKNGEEITVSDAEPSVMKFNEDQITQLMSTFWIQANLPDNTLSNIEALAYSFCLTLATLQLMNPDENLVVRIFQLPLSLWKISLDCSHEMLCPAHRRSLVTLSTAMLMFAAKIYRIPHIADILEPILLSDADTYLGISDDLQVYVKPEADVREYCSGHDNQVAACLLIDLRSKMHESYKTIIEILVQNLSNTTQVEEEELHVELLETFAPDDSIQSILHLDHVCRASRSKEAPSLNTGNRIVEDDAMSESSVSDLSQFVSTTPTPNSMSHVISIRQLLESAIEVAGEVAGTSISVSPVPFDAMAGRCEALGADSRNKISTCFSHPNFKKGDEDAEIFGARTMVLRLPPTSSFDNFLRAARC